MGNMMYHLMKSILGRRNSHELTDQEASQVVKKFYDEVVIRTMGCQNKAKMDWYEKKTLSNFGLERFAL